MDENQKPDISTKGQIKDEKSGRFNDIIHYQKAAFLDQFGLADTEGNLNTSVLKAIIVVIFGCFVWGGVRWLIIERSLHSFLIGLSIPILTSVFLIIIGYPIHCLLKKNSKLAKYEKWIIWGAALFICLVILDLTNRFGW